MQWDEMFNEWVWQCNARGGSPMKGKTDWVCIGATRVVHDVDFGDDQSGRVVAQGVLRGGEEELL